MSPIDPRSFRYGVCTQTFTSLCIRERTLWQKFEKVGAKFARARNLFIHQSMYPFFTQLRQLSSINISPTGPRDICIDCTFKWRIYTYVKWAYCKGMRHLFQNEFLCHVWSPLTSLTTFVPFILCCRYMLSVNRLGKQVQLSRYSKQASIGIVLSHLASS